MTTSQRLSTLLLLAFTTCLSCAGRGPSPLEPQTRLERRIVSSIESRDKLRYPNLRVVFEIHPEILPGAKILFLSNLHFFGSDMVIYQGETPRELRHIETVALDESGNLYFLSRKELPEFNRLVRKYKLRDLSPEKRLKLCQTFLLATWYVGEDLAFFSSWEEFSKFTFLSRAYKHAFSNFLWEGESRGVPVVRGHTLTEQDLANDRRLRRFWTDKARQEPAYQNLLLNLLKDEHDASLWLEGLDSTRVKSLFHPPDLEENPGLVVLLVASSGERQSLTRFIFEVSDEGEISIKRLEQLPIPVHW